MSKITVTLVDGAGSTYVGKTLCKKGVATEVDGDAFNNLKPVVKGWFKAGVKPVKPTAPKAEKKTDKKKKSDKAPAGAATEKPE